MVRSVQSLMAVFDSVGDTVRYFSNTIDVDRLQAAVGTRGILKESFDKALAVWKAKGTKIKSMSPLTVLRQLWVQEE